MTGKRLFFFLMFVLLSVSRCLYSLDPGKKISQYIIAKWTTEDGLPQNTVTSVLQTSDGFLWIGTQNGLARFDGITFDYFNASNYREFKSNFITTLFEDRNSNLWIGTRDGLIRCFKEGWERISTKDGLTHKVIKTLYEDNSGNLWIGTAGKGINVYKDGKLLKIKAHKDILPANVLAIFKKNSRTDSSLYIGTRDELIKYTLDKSGKIIEKSVLLKDQVKDFSCKNLDKLWAAGASGLFYIKNGTLKKYPFEPGISVRLINTLFEDRDGNLWIGTEGGGLNRLHKNCLTNFSGSQGLSNNSVYSVFEDKEGNLWIGTYTGINLLRDGKFLTYTEKDGLSNNTVWTICQDRSNAVWITTNNGLSCFKDNRFSYFTEKDGLSSKYVSTTWQDSKGILWIGTYDKGLNRMIKNRIFPFGKEKGLENESIHCIIEDRKGNLWVGTYGKGLIKIKDEKISFISTKNGLSSDDVFVIYEAGDGGLWIGTDGGGLNLLKKNNITVYTSKHGFSSDVIFSITEDKQGTLWIGTEESGLNYLKNDRIVPITTKHGLIDGQVYQIIEDDNGFFWLSGNKGITRVRKKELYDFVNGNISKIEPVLYGKSDGLRSIECNGSYQPAGWKTTDNRIWFPTLKGVVVIDPANIKINTTPPPVLIKKILLDGKPVLPGSYLTLEPHIKKIEILYTALSFSAPEKNKFKYMLVGFDGEWVFPDDRKDRVATYTNLPSGTYLFNLTACNNDGIWNNEGIEFEITVLPPFWKKWWFIAIAMVLFSIFSYYVLTLLKEFIKIVNSWKKRTYIAEYKIISQIGSGGMANIFKASRKRGKEKFAAVKIMKEEYRLDPVQRERFLNEGKIIDSIDHPNIVKIFQRGEHNNNLFIAMELLEGTTLAKRIARERTLFINESIDIMSQLTRAIREIHKAGIVHRDLKPENIMLVREGEKENVVKILDFGIAKTQALTRITETGMVVGTLCYISPEQLYDSEYSTASDIYSLGIIFYEMVTGIKPYTGESALEIMQEIMKGRIRKPQELRCEIPKELDALILDMIARKPEHRPPVDVLEIALEKISHGMGDLLKS